MTADTKAKDRINHEGRYNQVYTHAPTPAPGTPETSGASSQPDQTTPAAIQGDFIPNQAATDSGLPTFKHPVQHPASQQAIGGEYMPHPNGNTPVPAQKQPRPKGMTRAQLIQEMVGYFAH